MRIDYSEPRQSCTTSQVKPKPRKESSSFATAIIVATGITCFLVGFGTGWFLSQKDAKKAFKAATEQNSLESSKPAAQTQVTPDQPQTGNKDQQPQTGPSNTPGPQAATGVPTPPLSFYKSLPSGQKSEVLGSGINTKEEKNVPQQTAKAAAAATDKNPANDRSAAKNPSGNSFSVQVASFSLRSEAENMKTKLTAKGYSVKIVESNQGEKGVWYRVRVGSKLTQDAAKELKGKFGRESIVIPD